MCTLLGLSTSLELRIGSKVSGRETYCTTHGVFINQIIISTDVDLRMPVTIAAFFVVRGMVLASRASPVHCDLVLPPTVW